MQDDTTVKRIYGTFPQIGHDNSMGLVRYYLALAVVVAHFNAIFGTELYFPTSSYNAVGGFFALSGFLVYPSYLKSKNLRVYLFKRARRILPPYFFIVLVCAFGLCAVSSLSAEDYFFSGHWLKYVICNIGFLNFLEPTLPGVFEGSAIPAVNGSLWTMKIEILLYLSVPLVVYLTAKLHNRYAGTKPLSVFVAIYLLSIAYRLFFVHLYEVEGKAIYNILSRQVFGQMMYFYTGVCIFFNYEKFRKYRIPIAAVCLMMSLCSDLIPYYKIVAGPLQVSCLTLVASTFSGRISLFNKNNISYDIYLFHFPVIQVLSCFHLPLPPYIQLAFTLLIVIILGYLTWFGFEKRIHTHAPL